MLYCTLTNPIEEKWVQYDIVGRWSVGERMENVGERMPPLRADQEWSPFARISIMMLG